MNHKVPICCKQRMELKTSYSTGGSLGSEQYALFQCKKCKIVRSVRLDAKHGGFLSEEADIIEDWV